MKDSVIEEAASLWLVSAMDVSVKAMVLALLAGMALKLTRIADPNLRHRVWTGILIAMLALPGLSQLLPSLQLPFAIDTSWLLRQQGTSIVEERAPQIRNSIQTEAVDSRAIESGDTGQMNEPKLVSPRSDGGWRVSQERSLRSNFDKRSQAEHEHELVTTQLNQESEAAAAATRSDVSNAAPWQSKSIATMLFVILPYAFVFWMVIAVFLLARLALAFIGSFQLQSNSSSIVLSDLSDLDLPRELLHVCGRSLQLFECPRLKVPVTVGVLSPRIYLPAEWLEWTHEKLVTVLTHERTHIERRDCAVILLAELNRCIFWFHPLAWWLKFQLSALAEAACDDAVIGTTGDRTTYARHLLEVASVVARQRGRVSPMGLSMARCSNVETRIRSILDFTRPLSQKLTKVTSTALLLVIVPIVVVAASLQPVGHSKQTEPVFGSEFVYSADPARIISGTVKDAATGETLAGVRVESYKLDGYPFANHRVLKAVSDSKGRFQLVGMPKGAENQLIILPSDGMPFLTRTLKVPDPNGLGPIEMQIELNRGVLITGRVTDKVTGVGVPDCRLNYLPYRSNEFALKTPEFGIDENGQDDQTRYTTDADGRFQLVGLPGKAVIGVVSVFQNYRVGFGYDELTGPKEGNSDRIDTYRNPVNPSPKWPTSMREVEIDADAKNYSLDLQLDPGTSVRIAIRDLEGKPVTGITAQGLAPNGDGSATHDEALFATNFGPKETRSIILRHDKLRIGRVLRAGSEEVQTEQIAVVLEPFATVHGKLLLDEEQAATGVVVQARVLPNEDFSLSLPEVITDNEGRFQLDLIPGCKYYLDVRGNQIRVSSLAKELAIVAGQQIDMGTLVLKGDSFVAVQEPAKKDELKPGAPSMKPQNANPSMKQVGPIPPASSAASKVPTPNEVRPTSIVGTIRDEAGKALSGVTVGVTGIQIVEGELGLLDHQFVLSEKAISTIDGRFELKLPDDEKKLQKIKLVAGAEGYGIQWRDVHSASMPDSFDLVLPKLQPIRLRLVDIEGRPALGVSLAVTTLMRTGSPTSGEDFLGSLKDVPEMAQLWPPLQKTDSEGRCQILCVGNGIGAFLQVEGSEVFAPQSLVINSGEVEERGERDATFRAQVKNVSGDQELVMPLAPAQFFEGQITLADTGKPAAGVKVGVWASQQEFGSMVTVNGKTDDQGKYRINPEAGIRFGVTAYPARGEPYLAKTIPDITWGAGLKSKTVDIALPRGVLIRGRVLDKESNAPIAGVNVQYAPKGNNPNNSDDIITGWQCIVRTGEDGTFEISVLAGRGTLIVLGPRDAYVLKEMSGLELVGDRPGGDRNYANAFVPLELATGADPQELTVEIERGEKVVGKLVDENQALVDRAVMITRLKISAAHLTWRGFGDELEGGKFELTNLASGVEYKCSFLDPRRKLGATVLLRTDAPEPVIILKPCGTAKVRCVTSKGEPRDAIRPSLKIVATPGAMRYSDATQAGELAADEDFVANFDRVNYWNGPVTDAEGRAELPALIPGATYRFLGNIKGKLTYKDFTVEAGQTIDLGEIVLDRK